MLILQSGSIIYIYNIFFVTNISKGTAFLLQGLIYSDKVKLRHTHSTLQVKPNDDLKTVSMNTISNISKPNTVSEHSVTNDHSVKNIRLIPLELIKSNRYSVRKAREAYLIERGKTPEP